MVQPGKRRVFIVGIGSTKFEKPGRRAWDYPEMIGEAVNKALDDAKLKYTDIQQAAVGWIYGTTCQGQKGLYDIGMTGIPIYNVNNACASGSTGLYLMKQLIEGGTLDCGLAVGFEKMAAGSLEAMGALTDRANPAENHVNVISEKYGLEAAPMTAQMFGGAGREHMEKYGTKREHFAKISYKNHKHSVNNPDAQFQKEYSMNEILNSKRIFTSGDYQLGMLECSPTSDGSSAAVLCSEKFLESHPYLKAQAIEILGAQLGTDIPSAFETNSCIDMVGFGCIQRIAKLLYQETGLGPDDVQLIELHDCFAPNELITYEALGLCPIGKGGELVDRGDNTYGGKWVINPSGGLEAKGHPIGATGVNQAIELCKHLRGIAGKRQVPNAKVGMQHNIGIGGAGYVAMYRHGFPHLAPTTKL